MSRIKRTKPSPALMIAVVALVAALAGTAVGGVTISKLNNKEKKQVKKISKKQARKLDKRIELTPGPKGDQGQQGPKGDPGVSGATEVTRRISDLATATPSNSTTATVSCEAGERAVGGGGVPWNGSTPDFDMTGSRPIISGGDPDDVGVPVAWEARYTNRDANESGTGNIDIRAYVVCAAP